MSFEKMFGRLDSVVVGVVHLDALPGTPKNSKTIQQILDIACKETAVYFKYGVVGDFVFSVGRIPVCPNIVVNDWLIDC